MSKSGQLYRDTQDAYDCAIEDGYKNMKELSKNYAKYFKEFTGFNCSDPLYECRRIQEERDMMDSPL
tara:strand:- start:2142 stop:2342 length:201 start_codon:yes stop_codon:yes gene_type:complete